MDELERRRSLLKQLKCTPSRRSTKFTAGPNARQFFFFDSTVSRTDRQCILTSLFVLHPELIDRTHGHGVLASAYKPSTYVPDELVEVRIASDLRHPAYGQAGLYAKKTIPSNTIICPYAGFVEIFTTSCNSRTYTMGFGSSSDDYALDAEFAGNYGRFANDPRGLEGLSANVIAENRMNARGEFFTAMVSRRQIVEGEEILMAYGKAHSLSASPWTDVQGEPLMRVRRGGELPFPHLETEAHTSNGTCPTAAVDARTDSSTSSSEPAFELYWECPQCGSWTQGEATPRTLACCMTCGTPKLSNCPLVAALSHPPITRADLQRAHRAPCAVTAATRDTKVNKAEAASSSPLLLVAPPKCSSSPDTKTPASILAYGTSTRASQSSPTCASISPAPQVAVVPSTAQSPSSATSGASGGSHAHAHPPHTPHLHGVSYASIPIEWPLNVPFIPWQIWDPSVPLTTVMKLSRFETHEHIFLFHVTYNTDEAPDESGVIDADEDQSASEEEEEEEEADGEALKGEIEPGRTAKRRLSPLGARCAPTPRPTHEAFSTASRPAKRSRTVAPKDTITSEETPAASKTTRRHRVSDADRMCKRVRSQDEEERAATRTRRGKASHEATGAADVSAGSHNGSVCAGEETSQACAHACAALPVAPRGGAAALARLLVQRPREVERLVCLPAWSMIESMANQAPPHNGARSAKSRRTAAVTWQPPSPLRHARETLCAMSRRVLSGKAFEAGELVAYLGGAVRTTADTRCRPDWSPLCIPLRYILPSAWRRSVGGSRCDGHDAATASGQDKEGSSSASRARTAEARRAFLAHMASLVLVVTNEMMYCPCVIAPLENEQETDQPHLRTRLNPRGGDGSCEETEDAVLSPQAQQQQEQQRALYERERQAVLDECNVTLVLTMDALGSPFIAAIATRHIDAFEPLLARTQ